MAQINKPSDYFNTKLYTGNGATQSITGVGFQPDFTWIKERDTANEYHNLYDVIRGATKAIYSNDTLAESTQTGLTSFDSDGFSVGNFDIANKNTSGYASWNWLAGGTASSNTDGSITSQVSANTTSGFSIVSYTGNSTTDSNFTVGHGLSQTPDMIIIKNRDWASSSKGWPVWHSAISTGGVYLDSTDVSEANNFNYFFGAQPSSTTFSIRADTTVSTANRYRTNGQGDDYIAYCFAEKKGFSKFGSYTGNGNADGTFVYTGFKPAWLMFKRTDSTAGWFIQDNKRDTYNVVSNYLTANTSDAEATSGTGLFDFTSNGFKIRNSGTLINASGGTFIYMAFAENPLVGTNNIPATAR